MAGLAGFAAGLAEGFAGGRRLKSDLETEKVRRESLGLDVENRRLQNNQLRSQEEARTEATKLEQSWISGDGFRPEGADPSYNHRNDPEAVKQYYDRLRSVMRKQAVAFGRPTTEADKAVDEVIKSQLAERTGQTISLLQMSPERAGPAVRKLYEAFPDGGKISNITYDKTKDAYLMTGVGPDGTEGTVERPRKDVLQALSFGALNGTAASTMILNILENERKDARDDAREGRRIASNEKIASDNNSTTITVGRERNQTSIATTGMEVQGGIQRATIGAQGDVAAASIRANAAGGSEATDSRLRLKSQLDSLEKVFAPEFDAIKSDPRGSYDAAQRRKDIGSVQQRQGLAEDILRFNFELGNENLSARGVAALTEGLTSGQIDRSRFNGYLVQNGKQDKNYVVMDGGRLVVPTPGWLRREIDSKSKPQAGVRSPAAAPAPAPAASQVNPRTGRPYDDGPVNPRTGRPM